MISYLLLSGKNANSIFNDEVGLHYAKIFANSNCSCNLSVLVVLFWWSIPRNHSQLNLKLFSLTAKSYHASHTYQYGLGSWWSNCWPQSWTVKLIERWNCLQQCSSVSGLNDFFFGEDTEILFQIVCMMLLYLFLD